MRDKQAMRKALLDYQTQAFEFDPPLRMWRAESGYTHDTAATALDVVNYETKELGNDIGIYVTDQVLAAIPARKCKWVTQYHEYAATFGEPEPLTIRKGKTLAADNDGGLFLYIEE